MLSSLFCCYSTSPLALNGRRGWGQVTNIGTPHWITGGVLTNNKTTYFEIVQLKQCSLFLFNNNEWQTVFIQV